MTFLYFQIYKSAIYVPGLLLIGGGSAPTPLRSGILETLTLQRIPNNSVYYLFPPLPRQSSDWCPISQR